jgi:hypothetical protein
VHELVLSKVSEFLVFEYNIYATRRSPVFMIFQTLPDSRTIYVPEDTMQVEFCANLIEYSYTWSSIYICTRESV